MYNRDYEVRTSKLGVEVHSTGRSYRSLVGFVAVALFCVFMCFMSWFAAGALIYQFITPTRDPAPCLMAPMALMFCAVSVIPIWGLYHIAWIILPSVIIITPTANALVCSRRMLGILCWQRRLDRQSEVVLQVYRERGTPGLTVLVRDSAGRTFWVTRMIRSYTTMARAENRGLTIACPIATFLGVECYVEFPHRKQKTRKQAICEST